MPNSRESARRRRGAYLGAIAALFVSACSVVAIGYHFTPEFVYWRLDQALDFDAAQAADVRARLDRLHSWHRRSELAGYARAVGEVQARIGRPVSAADVTWLHDDIRRRYARILDAAAADAVEVVLGLRSEQLETLERRFARTSADFERQLVDVGPKRAREEFFQHVLVRLERWYGAFDDSTRGRLRVLAEEVPLDFRLELEDTRRRQRELLAFLRAVSAGKLTAREEIGERLKRFFGRWEEGRTILYAEYAERNRAALHRLYAEAANLATPGQRERARRELQYHIDEIAALAPPRTASREGATPEPHGRSLEQSGPPGRP
jgi:hypothetical protein